MKPDRQHWHQDDLTLLEEHAEVINLIRDEFDDAIDETPPPRLDNYVRQVAISRNGDQLPNHWILGQGPLVVLVTCILFAVAMMWLAS